MGLRVLEVQGSGGSGLRVGGFRGLGIRVWGVGSGFEGLGFRVFAFLPPGLGFRF